MKKLAIVIILGIVSLNSIAVRKSSNVNSSVNCYEDTDDSFFGTYEIIEAERYGGGLTDDESAKKVIGEKINFSKYEFRSYEDKIDNPIYELKHDLISKQEGNVHRVHSSYFFGYGQHRDYIDTLEIYVKKNNSKNFVNSFEIISHNEIWYLYDGWLYKLSRLGK